MAAAVVGAFVSLTPYHLLLYGTLLGTEIYQVFEYHLPEFPIILLPPQKTPRRPRELVS